MRLKALICAAPTCAMPAGADPLFKPVNIPAHSYSGG